MDSKYSIIEFVGKGKFGEVFKGENRFTGEGVAIKIETNPQSRLLKHETEMLHFLFKNGCVGIPLLYWYGLHNALPTMIMTYYDTPCTAEMFSRNSSHYIIQMISLIENIHKYGVIHRDVKPSNFMFRNGRDIHLIDFGFSTFYLEGSGQHKPNTLREDIIGTPQYISYFIHNGHEPSRRDDLISLGYIYLFLCFGFPHMAKQTETDDKHETHDTLSRETVYPEHHIKHPEMLKKREWKKIECLTAFFAETDALKYLHYCYSLQYDEKPNYSLLRRFFSQP
jgi:serine/threonine protein kinase